MKNSTFKIILALAIGFVLGGIGMKLSNTYGLGTEYQEWEKNQQSIENQNNSIQFVWEGLESDIPADGNQTLNLRTNENTVYLNLVDE